MSCREDRARRDSLVDLKNLKKKEHPHISLTEARDIAMDSIPKSEPPPFYDDELNEDTYDLESMLVELAKLTEDPELYCRDDHWELMIDGEEPGPEQIKEFHGKTPTEAVRAALDEMKKQ